MSENTYYGTGRRKRAMARVWLFKGQKGFTINGHQVKDYLKRDSLAALVEEPLKTAKAEEDFRVKARVSGGGITGQAGAVRLGIARALLLHNETLRSSLRREGFLTRDPREKERKKPGRKSARRSFQFTKR
jgi:small subunit ribosomal protein S9